MGTHLPHRSIYRPSAQAVLKRTAGHSEPSRPFANGKSFFIVRNKAVVASVLALLQSCSPATVLFAVSFVVVYSFKLVSLWRLSHVAGESHETTCGSPLFANRYAATAIVGIACGFLVVASLLHSCPYFVKSGIESAVLNKVVAAKTSATLASSDNKVVGTHRLFFAAIASAKPKAIDSSRLAKSSIQAYYGPPSKSFSSKVCKVLRGIARLGSRHGSLLLSGLCSGPCGASTPCGSLIIPTRTQFNQDNSRRDC